MKNDETPNTELGMLDHTDDNLSGIVGHSSEVVDSVCFKDCWKKFFKKPANGKFFDSRKKVTITPTSSWATLHEFTVPVNFTCAIEGIGQRDSGEDYSTLSFKIFVNGTDLSAKDDGIGIAEGVPYADIAPESELYKPSLLLHSRDKITIMIKGAVEDTERIIYSRICGTLYRVKCCKE